MITPPGADLRPIGQLMTGTLLYQGRFRIDLLLTASPTHALYRAWDVIQQRVVTLLEFSTSGYQAAKSALERAAPLLEYDHVAITPIQVIFVEHETLYFMLGFGGGQTIEQIMRDRTAPIVPSAAIRWIVQAADSVLFLTSHLPEWGMGDLSPSALLVTAEDRVQPLGFALPLGLVTPITLAHALPPGAVAPELSTGQSDTLSDVYSLAATLHFLLTRRRWHPEQGNALETIKELRPDLARSLLMAMQRGLAEHPADRWPDLAAFRQAIVGSLAGDRSLTGGWAPVADDGAIEAEPPTLVATREHLQAALAAEAAFHAARRNGQPVMADPLNEEDELSSTAPRPVVQIPTIPPAQTDAAQSPSGLVAEGIGPPPQEPSPPAAEPTPTIIAWGTAPMANSPPITVSPPAYSPQTLAFMTDSLMVEATRGIDGVAGGAAIDQQSDPPARFADVEALLASRPGAAIAPIIVTSAADSAPDMPSVAGALPTAPDWSLSPFDDPEPANTPAIVTPFDDPEPADLTAGLSIPATPAEAQPIQTAAVSSVSETSSVPEPLPIWPIGFAAGSAAGFLQVHHGEEVGESSAPPATTGGTLADLFAPPAASTSSWPFTSDAMSEEPPVVPIDHTTPAETAPPSEPPAPVVPESGMRYFAQRAPSPEPRWSDQEIIARIDAAPPSTSPALPVNRAPSRPLDDKRSRTPSRPLDDKRNRTPSRPLDAQSTRTPSRPLGSIFGKLRQVLQSTPSSPVKATGTIVLPRQMFPQHVYSILVRIQRWSPRDPQEAAGDGMVIVQIESQSDAFYLPTKKLALQLPAEGGLSEGTLTVTALRPSPQALPDRLSFTFRTSSGLVLHEDPFIAEVTILPITQTVGGQPMMTLVHTLDLP